MMKLHILHANSPVRWNHVMKRTNQHATTERLFIKHIASVISALDHNVSGQQTHFSDKRIVPSSCAIRLREVFIFKGVVQLKGLPIRIDINWKGKRNRNYFPELKFQGHSIIARDISKSRLHSKFFRRCNEDRLFSILKRENGLKLSLLQKLR